MPQHPQHCADIIHLCSATRSSALAHTSDSPCPLGLLSPSFRTYPPLPMKVWHCPHVEHLPALHSPSFALFVTRCLGWQMVSRVLGVAQPALLWLCLEMCCTIPHTLRS